MTPERVKELREVFRNDGTGRGVFSRELLDALEAAQRERDEAVSALRVIGEELPGSSGDRAVTIAKVRAVRAQIAALRAALEKIGVRGFDATAGMADEAPDRLDDCVSIARAALADTAGEKT